MHPHIHAATGPERPACILAGTGRTSPARSSRIHIYVRKVAVSGVPDPDMGEKVAVVQPVACWSKVDGIV